MDDPREIAKALGLAEVTPELYRDLLQPAVREVGQSLEIIARGVKLTLAPLEAAVWVGAQVRPRLAATVLRRLGKVPESQIQEPPPEIVGPATLNFAMTSEGSPIRDLYAELIASAMRKDRVASVHPSFAAVIAQLSPDEALILSEMAGVPAGSIVDVDASPVRERAVMGGHPAIRLIGGFRQRALDAGVANPTRIETYRDNFIRLRILTATRQLDVVDGGAVAGPSGSETTDDQYSDLLHLSAFGRDFIEACLGDVVASRKGEHG